MADHDVKPPNTPNAPKTPTRSVRRVRRLRRLGFLFGFLIALAISPAALAFGGVDVQRDIAYSSPLPGRTLRLDAFLPARGPGPFPAVVVIHGGSWSTGDRAQFHAYARLLARRGFAAFAIEYRLAPADPFPAQIHACKAAVRFIRREASRFRVDARRIGAFGYSAGGHLALLLATTGPADGLEGPAAPGDPSAAVQAVAVGGAPTNLDFVAIDSTEFAGWLGGPRARVPAAYRAASPVNYVTYGDPPIFLYHGLLDRRVSVAHAAAMLERCRAAGVEARSRFLPLSGHLTTALSPGAFRDAADFLEEKLRP